MPNEKLTIEDYENNYGSASDVSRKTNKMKYIIATILAIPIIILVMFLISKKAPDCEYRRAMIAESKANPDAYMVIDGDKFNCLVM